MRPITRVLECLPGARRSGSSWRSCCPVHGGRRRSLSISEGSNGSVLMHCFGGCDWKDVVRALKLEPRDLREVHRG